ncbi:MAG: SH3-like domain-containing protein [Caldilineaceae bacterium]|nr:SH3-like domain-containing protein [Caldilineaceae bacterium]
MPDQRASENWRLEEEGGKEADKWLLQESEQQVSDQWTLQQPPVEPINSWQPVEYVKAPRPAGAWILPAIITVALLVTLGYAGYRVIPGLLSGESEATSEPVVAVDTSEGTPAPEDEAATDVAVAPVDVPTTPPDAAAPTATLPAPTPTMTSSLVAQDFATVNSAFGVNARFSPNTDAAIIRILEDGERLFVFSQQGEWIEVFVADTPLTEGQPLSGTVGFAASEFFTVTTQEITQQLRDQVLAYAGKLPTPTPEPPAAGAPVTDTGAALPSAPILTVTINAINGVNVRRGPADVDETNIIRLLENGTVLPATGRTSDNLWIQVTLPDAVSGWIAAEFLVPSADITSLPVVDGSETITTTVPVTEAAPVTATDVVTSGVEPPAPYTSVVPGNSEPAIIVTVIDGVNARIEPALDADVEVVVPQGAVLPARGRSADNQWVQVELPTGVLAWIFRDTVTATPAVGALPAVGGPTPEPILIPTATPGAAPVTPEPTTAPAATTVTAEVIPFFLPVYSAANNESDTVVRSSRGTDFVVIGQNADGSWLQVTTPNGETGWVVAGNVRVTGDLDGVPVVE